MTKLAFVADVHIANHKRWGGQMINGVNQRATEVLDALRRAREHALVIADVDAFIVLGDLFDHTRPTPQLVRATADALTGEPAASRSTSSVPPSIVLLGNHDIQSDGSLDHACASLDLIPGIEVIQRPTLRRIGNAELALCPYLPGLASEWLPDSISQILASKPRLSTHRLLATHVGIWAEDTPSFMKAARDAVGIGQLRFWCEAFEIEYAFAGNWHAYRHFKGVDEPSAIIPGTLAPAGFQEADQERVGWLVIYDTDTGDISRIPIRGPRFYTLAPGDALPSVDLHNPARCYVRIRCTRETLDDALALQENINAAGHGVASILLDEVSSGAAVREAATIAIAASNGEGPIAEYTALVDVAAPGTKEGVSRRLAAYRKAAQ